MSLFFRQFAIFSIVQILSVLFLTLVDFLLALAQSMDHLSAINVRSACSRQS